MNKEQTLPAMLLGSALLALLIISSCVRFSTEQWTERMIACASAGGTFDTTGTCHEKGRLLK